MNLDFSNPIATESNLTGYIENYNITYSLGEKYFNESHYAQAINNYNHALENCMSIVNVYKSLDKKDNEELYSKIYDRTKDKLVNSILKQGTKLLAENKNQEAMDCLKYSLFFDSKNADIYSKIAESFQHLKMHHQATDYFNKAIKINPNLREAYRMNADSYYNRGENGDLAYYEDAIVNYRKYIEYETKNDSVCNMLGHIYSKIGKFENAIEFFKKALEINPEFDLALGNLIYTSLKSKSYTQKDIYLLTKSAVDKYIKAKNIEQFKHTVAKANKNKKLHIAYISPDFLNHAVMFFLEPILANYDKEKFTVTCYSNGDRQDEVTQKCKGYVDKFVDVRNITDDKELASMIKNDNVDILVDLGGHTGGNRLLALAYKPAPIQATYLGYPNTSGLSAVDYILTSKGTINDDELEYFVEKPYHLDLGYETFNFVESAYPKVAPLPLLENGYVTFGYFNCITKINSDLIKTYSEILKSVPNSKLLIHRQSIIDSTKEMIYGEFKKNGIEMDRITIENKRNGYYEFMNKADIALDPFPYNGTTTTIDSIIMGLPVTCIYGDSPHKRSSARINSQLGFDELIAYDENQYANLVTKLANDVEKLAELRTTLRDKFKASSICDGEAFTRSLERFYTNAWDNYCQD